MSDTVKLIDSFVGKKERDLIAVDGYIRQMEKDLFVAKDDQIIPSEINALCFEYYANILDRFDPVSHAKNLSVQNYEVSRSRKYGGVNTAFLSNLVNEGVNYWTFELIEVYTYTSVYIGLWDNKQEITSDDLYRNDMMTYDHAPSFNTRFGELRGDTAIIRYDDIYKKQCPRCKNGDIIKMVLEYNDHGTCFVNYIVNDKDYGVAFNLPKSKYRAFVCLY